MESYRFYRSQFKDEVYLSAEIIDPSNSISFFDFYQGYLSYLEKNHLSKSHEIWVRVFCSDIANQHQSIEECFSSHHSLLYTIGQAPANNTKYALQAYFRLSATPQDINKISDSLLSLSLDNTTTYFQRFRPTEELSPNEQCNDILEQQSSVLQKLEMTYTENLHRTWFYVRDIDNNYSHLVDRRRDLFSNVGLTPKTHYIASTGIEGKVNAPHALFELHSTAIKGIAPESIKYLNAFDYLGRTDDYGVTFERGTSLSFKDRRHIYISGTASINPQGQVLHLGDVKEQTKRALKNIEMLLCDAKATMNCIFSMIVYLRDRSDLSTVQNVIESLKLSNAVINYVEGAVCRPTWLVEIEAIAMTEI